MSTWGHEAEKFEEEARLLKIERDQLQSKVARLDEDKQHLETFFFEKEDTWSLKESQLQSALAEVTAQRDGNGFCSLLR
ncbi:hypothetical protein L1987_81237 [Smallanthus sonchifolius]|uniref:Uncharacterized protein n=1 Tax=Smallanthus sonchifolius TaxID=185202 RepID=A0ACB8YR54_9ASTR|nr:hypothetical protein L1987_81237 [Smallanthus sonchifolius]